MADTVENNPVGRPSKYESRFSQEAIEFIGNGKSVTQFARHIRVSKSTVYLWAKEHPEFSDALSLSQDWSQAVWEDKLEDMMFSKEVNAPLVKLYFANRFNWTDKQQDQSSQEDAQPLTIGFDVRPAVDTVEITNAKP